MNFREWLRRNEPDSDVASALEEQRRVQEELEVLEFRRQVEQIRERERNMERRSFLGEDIGYMYGGRPTYSTIRMPKQYQFDFAKINSIEDIGRVLEILCSHNHFQMTEEYIRDLGIEEIVKEVER